MIRSIVAVVAGVFFGGVVVFLLELPGMLLHPLPPGFDWHDSKALSRHFSSAPTALKIMVVLAWAVGPLVGSLVACWIARRAFVVHAMVVGFIFVLLDLINLLSFPHPVWMWIGGLVAPPVTAWLGAKLAQRIIGPQGPGTKPYDMREKNVAC